MGMTITEKNMARHAGLDVVKPGQIIECHLDAVLMNDITFPPARKEFLKIGKPVFDRHKIYLVPDHFTPNKDICYTSESHARLRTRTWHYKLL